MWYLNEFLHELASQQLHSRSIQSYRLHLDRFIRYCTVKGIEGAGSVTEEITGTYIQAHIEESPYSPGWRYVAKLYLRRYFEYLSLHSYIFCPPSIPVRHPRYRSGSYRALPREDLNLLLDTYPCGSDADLMVKAILELSYSAALRPGEVRRLKVEDIDFRSGLLFIEQSKGMKDRMVPVGNTALQWLRKYLKEVRPGYVKDPDDTTVFVGMRTGCRFRHRAFSQFVHGRLKIHGFTPFVPYQMRSSAATHMVTGGMSTGYVQRILGHIDLRTTQSYVQLHVDDLKEKLAAAHPRNSIEKHIQERRKT